MTNISDVYVPITISEEDILDISIGQEASVSMTAFPNQSFDAVVDTIAVEASRSGAATVSYTVTVRFREENDQNMYEGMSAEVTLLQHRVSDALYVSIQAVTNTNGQATVLKKGADGAGVVTNVTTGFSDGRYVEIRSGLNEGDIVLAESAVGRT
jgi:HlyD family secretion protein